MLQRKNRTIRLWAGVFMLTLGIITGITLSASGVFAGAATSSVANPPVTKASGAPAQDQGKQELDKDAKPAVDPKGEPSSKGISLLPQSSSGVPNPPQGYTIVTSTGASLVPGTTDTGNHTDDGVTNVALPFTFDLYGTPFNSVNVSSNGNLQFSSGNTAFTNACLPVTSGFGFSIFPYWDDQITVAAGTGCPVGGCGVFTSTSGSAPNRIFNIEWRSCVYTTGAVCGPQLNYEARLHEGSQSFDVVYAQLDPATNGGTATVGVQYVNGALFTQFECNTANSLSNSEQLTFIYDPGTDPTFTPLPPNTATNTSLPTNTPTNTATITPTPNCTPSGYSMATGTATIVPGVTDTGNHTDDGTTAINLPFAFNFYGSPFTQANVSSNGNLQFTSNSTSLSNVCLPTATLNNAIIPHWDDLRTDQTGTGCTTYAGGCGIFTDVTGTAPNRIFNIEWRAVYFSPNTTALNFEVRLYETTGQIQFIYATVPNSGVSATVGVQKGTGSGGTFTQFSCNTSSLSNGLLITFSYVPGNCPSPTATNTISPTITPFPCGPGSNYVEVEGTTAIVPGVTDTGNHTDDGTTLITLPFAFNFYGTLPFTNANVSSNGNLQFTSNTSTLSNACLPSTTINNAIMAYWDDLLTSTGTGCSIYSSGCGVFTTIEGVAPNRIFDIEWRAVEFAAPANVENFEIRLYEGASGTFDLVYGTTASGGTSATIGVQKDTGSLFTQHSCNAPGVHSGMSLNFASFPCGVNTYTPTATRTSTVSPTFTLTPTITLTRTPTTPPTATATPPTCGPGSNYVVATGTATMIPGVTDSGNHTDDGITAISIPFTFNFYGVPFTSVNAGANGNLQFASADTEYINECLPSASPLNYLIAPHWDDLMTDVETNCAGYPGGTCGIYTTVQGSAPNRIFVIEWRAVYYPAGAAINFEVLLYENGGRIDFVYGNVPNGGVSATIGVQRGLGPQVTQYSCNTSSVTNGNLITLTEPSCGASGVIHGQVTWQNVGAANRPNVTGTLAICVSGAPQNFTFNTDTTGAFTITSGLADGVYNWRLAGGRHITNSSPQDGTAINIAGGSATQNFGAMKGGNTNPNPPNPTGDNIVNATDFTRLKNEFGQGGLRSSDFNYDLVVNSSDFTILKGNFGQGGHFITCP